MKRPEAEDATLVPKVRWRNVTIGVMVTVVGLGHRLSSESSLSDAVA